MPDRSYWLDLFTAETWAEFRSAGGSVSGFSEHRWGLVSKMKRGDYLLCYLTGISRFIGLLEVTSEPYQDESRIWASSVFPSRIRVRTIVGLTPETAVPVSVLKDRLSMFKDLPPGAQWTGPFRGSPARWREEDALVVIDAVREADHSPVARSFDARKLARPMKRFVPDPTGVGSPSSDEPERPPESATKLGTSETSPVEEGAAPGPTAKEERAHTEIQWILGKIANDLGLSVWFPPSDRGHQYDGHALSELTLGEIPLMFMPKALRTIRNIDVLWIGDGTIEAAFEVESTTSIYSGVLRLADLIALVGQGISIPLYIVAPDDRRKHVFREVTRPAFGKLQPPMKGICRYLAFSTVRTKIPAPELLQYMNPHFIGQLSEACLPEED